MLKETELAMAPGGIRCYKADNSPIEDMEAAFMN